MIYHHGKKDHSHREYSLWDKNSVMYSDDGCPYFVDPYCGSKYGGLKESKNLCTRSVIDCVTEIDDFGMTRKCFFNNRFPSLSLLAVLKELDLTPKYIPGIVHQF